MTLEELLEKDKLHPKDISRFLNKADLKSLKKADLDLVVKKFGQDVLEMGEFGALYDLKVKESNRRLLFWLVLTAVLAGILGISTSLK